MIDELESLCERRANGDRHPKEDSLEGRLAGVGYLRLYSKGHSLRPYFTVLDGTVWMLALDRNKRRTDMSQGMEARLKDRLEDVRGMAKRSSK